MNIMLACNAGMSTSLVVSKMQQAAKEQGIDCTIWAVNQNDIKGELGKFDVLLLGPQLRYVERKIRAIVGDAAPVAYIDPTAYGTCNGKIVLEQALDILNGKEQ